MRRSVQKWRSFRKSSGFRNAWLYLIFVGISALFWLIMALNDSVTRTVDVRLAIAGVPDSVKFITDPPSEFHVTIRDKGTRLMRNGVMHNPTVTLNYRDYAENGVFRVTHSDMNGALKTAFGSTAQISSCSLDSLNLMYTTGKGKRVPVVVSVDVSASPGFIISQPPVPAFRSVTVYSTKDVLDTINRVFTKRIVKRNLDNTAEEDVGFVPIRGARIEPSKVRVKIPVEPLVRKESMVTVVADGMPEGKGMVFFPAKVPVVYYLPMGLFNSEDAPFEVHVNYQDIFKTNHDRVKVRIGDLPDYVENVELKTDSVEYSLIEVIDNG